MSAASSLCMNYQTTFTLSPNPGAVGTWSFNATMLPHPINFMAIQATDSVAPLNYEVLNSQIPGADHRSKAAWLWTNAQQWRLAYAGVTVTQDGPDLANQGTMVVAQSPVDPYTVYGCAVNATPAAVGIYQTHIYTAEDLPDFNTSQAMPNAYFDQSKKGAYIPLKLTRVVQRWSGQKDLVCNGNTANPSVTGYVFPTGECFSWPHWHLPCPRWAADQWFATPTSPMLNDIMAHVCAKNLAVTTSFTFFFRYGIEMRVCPSSSLSPQLEISPRHDELALYSYYAISRELKDAYEAKFNDLGKLWGVISSVASDILPIISKIGPAGKSLATVGQGVVGLGDVIQKRRRRRRRPAPAPAPAPAPRPQVVIQRTKKRAPTTTTTT